MNTVRDIIWAKENRDVYTIEPRAHVYEAVALFAAHNIAALMVVESNQVIGCFSERELARGVVLNQLDPKSTKIYEAMDPAIFTVELETTIDDCMCIMTNELKRHLPVVQDKKLVGVVSVGDIVKAKIHKQADIIDQLQNYITS